MTGLDRHVASESATDLYVEPPLDEFGIGEYVSIDRIVPVGYDAMRAALDECDDEPWLAGSPATR